MSIKNKLINEASKFLQMIVPLTYTIDKFAPLPYEARPVYAIGSLLLSRLEEDDGIASAIDVLDFTLRFDKEILPCPRDYLANLFKDIIFQFTVAVKRLPDSDDEMKEALNLYLKLDNIWVKYRMYTDKDD